MHAQLRGKEGLHTGLSRCRGESMRFGLEGGRIVILDRELAISEGPQILKQHAITFDRSADLRYVAGAMCAT